MKAPNIPLLQRLPRLRIARLLKLILLQILERLPRVDDLGGDGIPVIAGKEIQHLDALGHAVVREAAQLDDAFLVVVGHVVLDHFDVVAVELLGCLFHLTRAY